MADDTESSGVSRQAFSVAYAGSTIADVHTINVEALAPALLAFGKLLRAANAEFNGDKTTAKVLVASDFEHKCFNINFESVVSLIDTVKGLLGIVETTKSAKEILEWVGILSPPGAATSYLGYLKWRRGRKIKEKTELADQDTAGLVRVTVDGVSGDNNSIVINNHIYNMGQSAKALKATRDAFIPIGQDGFERVEFKEGEKLLEVVEPDETQAILASCNQGIEESDITAPQVDVVNAWLSACGPVLDQRADKWRFRLGTDTIYADISETQIAQNALERGGVMVNDSYFVQLEITTPVGRRGSPGKPSFKILKVNQFVPGNLNATQGNLFSG